jgi:ATP-dependent Clp protease adaptor protein ClpS
MSKDNCFGTGDLHETKSNTRKPKMYMVIMHNDDYTTMDFVVEVLMKIFHKSSLDASNIMFQVHNNGKGVAGVYTYDIAATKKLQANQMAGHMGFPLKLTLDEAIE